VAVLGAVTAVSTLEDWEPSLAHLDSVAGEFEQPSLGAGDGLPSFPGPRFGMPGYKESHNWEDPNEVDLFSPLIFNWRGYAAKYPDEKLLSQKKAEDSWVGSLKQVNYPNCRHGRQHDHPPGGFNLNLYFYHNQPKSLGENPLCLEIAKHFLSTGIFEGLQWSPVVPQFIDTRVGYPVNDGTDVKLEKVPPSSWSLCKWRGNPGSRAGEPASEWLGKATATEVYSKTLKPFDMIMTNMDYAMPGYWPAASYTVTFWYRPYTCFKGEVFNFGASDRFDAKELPIYSAPRVTQISCNSDGVQLRFNVGAEGDEAGNNDPCDMSGDKAFVPWNKWSFLALSVKSTAEASTSQVFQDNGKSHLEKVASGDQIEGQSELSEVVKCNHGAATYVPETQANAHWGFVVSAFMPTSINDLGKSLADRGTHKTMPDADLAGLSYYSKGMSKEEVERFYRVEERGVEGWTVIDARSSNNGVCG
jgi:hypothetical protein